EVAPPCSALFALRSVLLRERGGGRREATRTFLLLPPRAGEGRDGGAPTGRQDAAADAVVAGMVRGSGMPPPHPPPLPGEAHRKKRPLPPRAFHCAIDSLPPLRG